MSIYFPIFLTITLLIVQSHNSEKGRFLLTLFIAITFSFAILFLFMDYNYLFFLYFGNLYLYLLALVTFFHKINFQIYREVINVVTVFSNQFFVKYI